MNEVTLTPEQAATAHAIVEAINFNPASFWPVVAAIMRDDFGIPDPDAAVDDLLIALQS